MNIKLDTKAIRLLIENDEEFKLDLQRAVVSEIVKKTVLRDARPISEYLSPE